MRVTFPRRGAAGLVEQRARASLFGQETAAGSGGWSIVRGSQPDDYQGTGRNVRIHGFNRHPVVQACIRVIAETVGAVEQEVFRLKRNGDVETLETHPLQQLLDAPRGKRTALSRRVHRVADFVAYGNAFTLIERARRGGMPTGFLRIPPESVIYVHLDEETQEIAQYDWRDITGRRRETLAEDVVHDRDLTLGEGLFGYPRGAAALLAIASDNEASQYVRQVVANSGSPGLAILLETVKDQSTLELAEQKWREQLVSRGNRGMTKFMSNVRDIKELGLGAKELEFPSLRGIAREDICAAMGVDPRIISVASAKGSEGGLSGQQYAEARRRLVQQTGLPILKAFDAQDNVDVSPEFGFVFVRYSPDSLSDLTENESETSTRTLAELAGGLITREEGRKRLKQPETMDPTHTLVGTMARQEYPVALQFAHTQADERNPGADTVDPNNPDAVQPGSAAALPPKGDDPKALPAPKDATPNESRAVAVVRSRVIRRGIALTAAQRGELWSAFDTRAKKAEAPYERAALLQFAAERADVQRAFADAARSQRSRPAWTRAGDDSSEQGDRFVEAALARIGADYATNGAYHAAWLARYQALIGQTMRVAGEDVAAAAGISFDLANPAVTAAANARANKLAGNVTDTTYEQIRAAVAAGREAGMGAGEIADLIDATVFDGQAPARALNIARTESVGAMNAGEFTTAKASGVMQSKEWLTQGDDRVRESHADIDGMRVPLDEPFPNGLQHPGDQAGDADEVCGCRCTTLFYDEAAPEGADDAE